jgi:hypothetical protein
MAKKAKVTAKNSGTHIPVDVKVGILHTIADAIYSTPAGKIREAVANARDNEASWVAIVVDQATRSIFICDNGKGITKKRFHEIFEAIGYGLLRTSGEKLSYFGLGLMSIFQLGKKVEMFTRAKGTSKILKLVVDTDSIFKEGNEKKSISELKNDITLNESTEKDRKNATVGLLNDYLESKQFFNSQDSFTEIIIRDITTHLETICDDNFFDELRKWLPLKAERDDPFLKRLTGKKGKEVRTFLENNEYCKTVDVFFGIQEDATIEQLWKYFPSFRSDVVFPDDNVYTGKSKGGDFIYYIVHSVAVDLQRGEDIERETGFWVRNQNFLVKSADFLERPGPGRKIKTIDQPLKPWIFGEIFHKDMNRFLTVSRNDFVFDKESFKEFQQEVIDIVNLSQLNQELRAIYEKKNKILSGLVEPFIKLGETKGTIQATERRLRKIIQHDGTEKEFNEEMLTRLKKARHKEIEREEYRVDNLLRRTKNALSLGQDEDALVKIEPSLKGKIELCDVTWDSNNKRIIAMLSPDLFQSKDVIFLGKKFELIYVARKDSDEGVSIDVDGNKIYVNPFNRDLAQYTVSIFDVYVALQIAKSISNTPGEMAKNVLALLGVKSDVSERYIIPFGDDLRRTFELARKEA